MSVQMERSSNNIKAHYTTVYRLIHRFEHREPVFETTESCQTYSMPGPKEYPNIHQKKNIYNHIPTKEGIDWFLRPDRSHGEPETPIVDNLCLANPALPLPQNAKQVIASIEDVQRDFYQNFNSIFSQRLLKGLSSGQGQVRLLGQQTQQ